MNHPYGIPDLNPLDRAVLRAEIAWQRLTQTRVAAAITAWWHRPRLGAADAWARRWAEDPANWCDRPWCERCFGGGR